MLSQLALCTHTHTIHQGQLISWHCYQMQVSIQVPKLVAFNSIMTLEVVCTHHQTRLSASIGTRCWFGIALIIFHTHQQPLWGAASILLPATACITPCQNLFNQSANTAFRQPGGQDISTGLLQQLAFEELSSTHTVHLVRGLITNLVQGLAGCTQNNAFKPSCMWRQPATPLSNNYPCIALQQCLVNKFWMTNPNCRLVSAWR